MQESINLICNLYFPDKCTVQLQTTLIENDLEQAAFLLINSSLTITDIAFHTGYNSRQHFAATFEKYYGSGPRAYRQLHGKQLETTTGKERFSEKDGIWNSKPL